MYHFHMLWFIYLNIFLAIVYAKKFRSTKKVLIPSIVCALMLLCTVLIVHNKKHTISYHFYPFEVYFIALVFGFAVANILSLKLVTQSDRKYFYFFLTSNVIFLFLTWTILLAPKEIFKTYSYDRLTDYSLFRKVLDEYSNY